MMCAGVSVGNVDNKLPMAEKQIADKMIFRIKIPG